MFAPSDDLLDKLLVPYFAAFAVAAYFNWKFRRRLRLNHPTVWAEVGTSFLNNSIGKSSKGLSFMLKKEYRRLNDPTLDFYGSGARIGFLVILFSLLLFILLSLAAQVQNGVWQSSGKITYPGFMGGSILALVIIYLSLHVFLFKTLKARHPNTWASLGRPMLFLNNTISNNMKVLAFVWRGDWKPLNDKALTICVRVIQFLFVLIAGAFAACAFGLLNT